MDIVLVLLEILRVFFPPETVPPLLLNHLVNEMTQNIQLQKKERKQC